MNHYLKYILISGLLFLIVCCVFRQRRYWREMQTSRPTGSLKAGYKLASLTIALSLAVAIICNTQSMWEMFISVVITAAIFCVKITFAGAVAGATLAICTVHLYTNDSFPLLEVWTTIVRVVTWRLPEEYRIAYASVSFLWTIAVLVTSVGRENSEGVIDSIGNSLSA